MYVIDDRRFSRKVWIPIPGLIRMLFIVYSDYSCKREINRTYFPLILQDSFLILHERLLLNDFKKEEFDYDTPTDARGGQKPCPGTHAQRISLRTGCPASYVGSLQLKE
jgi:hypothetical protein